MDLQLHTKKALVSGSSKGAALRVDGGVVRACF